MPLVANSDLPTFQKLKDEGRLVLPAGRAAHQDIREMHIGLLNMMPDAALEATEQQFFRLIGESNQIAQFHVHPFTLPELERGEKASAHIEKYYKPFEQLQEEGLDALIITGANVTQPDLSKEAFWQPLQDVMHWSYDHVTSTICSCLATHAYMEFTFGEKRTHMPEKLWGVYRHGIYERAHPIVRGINTIFDVPHSRHNNISREQFERSGMRVLVATEDNAHTHMAVSKDGFRIVCLQGHPEYDMVSLLKEYKRELGRYSSGERENKPPYPAHYFGPKCQQILEEYDAAFTRGQSVDDFPEDKLDRYLENTWRDTAKSMMGNWVGQVYQTTHVEREKQFMDGIDPDDPLGLRERS